MLIVDKPKTIARERLDAMQELYLEKLQEHRNPVWSVKLYMDFADTWYNYISAMNMAHPGVGLPMDGWKECVRKLLEEDKVPKVHIRFLKILAE